MIAANASAERLFGYPEAGLSGVKARSLRGESYTDELREEIRGAVLAGNVWRGRLEFLNREGGTGFHETVVSPWRNDAGDIIGLISANRDISTDMALVAETDLVLEAIRNSNFGVTIADATAADLPLTYVNQAFEKMTGYAFSEILGRNCRFLQGPETDRDAVLAIREAIRREVPITTMILNYRKDGSRFWNRLQLSPIHDGQGNLCAFMSIQLDITRDVATRAVERERQKMESLGRFAGGVAHDVNNALQPIILMGETLSDTAALDESEAATCVRSILENAYYAKDIVGRLLQFSKREGSAREAVSPHRIFEDAVRFAGGMLPRDVELKVSSTEDGSVYRIDVNRTEFVQIFTNLFLNASQAMSGKGRLDVNLDTVTLPLSRGDIINLTHGRYARFTISDTGSGIPTEDLTRIFDPFFTSKRPTEGTGLGLTTAYGIVQGWGGTITAENDDGAKFSVYIPLSSTTNADAT